MSNSVSPSPDLRPAVATVFPGFGAAMLVMAMSTVAFSGLIGHAAVGLSAPLWLDENWTGALAAVPSLSDLIQDVRDDPNAPAYYLLIWAWAKLFGLSDIALHVPGIVLGCLAPVAAWLGLRASRPRVAIVWGVAVGIWGPGIVQAGYARCYSLLLLAVVLSCVTFVRLLDAPTRTRAVAWAGCGALVILTQYHGALLIGLQGAAWLALHRRRALAHWPAALAFLPALGWIAWHLPRLALFARPEVAWYHPLTLAELPDAAAALAGVPRSELITVAVALLLLELLVRRSRSAVLSAHDVSLMVVGGTALAAAVGFVVLGCFRPLYCARYLMSFAPGVLLLVSSRLVAVSRDRTDLLSMLVGGYAVLATTFWLCPPIFGERLYSYEAASAWVAQVEPRRLAFFWDNPTAWAMTEHQLDRAGGFFLRRAGLDPAVAAIPFRYGVDMNGPMMAAVTEPRTALLWLWDTNVHDTTARVHPPRTGDLGTGLECRDFGAGPIGVLACRPKPDAIVNASTRFQ